MAAYRYVVIDVFTDTPLQGNQLAVFTDARGLDDATMQALALEIGFSETTFVLPAAGDGDVRARIFTPQVELPLAGHPILGTAFVLAAPLQRDTIRIETGMGVIPVELDRDDAGAVVFGRMTQPVPTVEPYPRPEALLRALGLDASRLPVERYDNGVQHTFLALDSPEQVAALRPDLAVLAELGAKANCFARAEATWKTRMFAPSVGVSEDPATGSAAGPLAVHLCRHGLLEWGEWVEISQGAEIARPSTLFARADGQDDVVSSVHVGGRSVIVARGEFRI